jgi:hypothetical protein
VADGKQRYAVRRRVVSRCRAPGESGVPEMANVRLPASKNGIRRLRHDGLRALSVANHAPMTEAPHSRSAVPPVGLEPTLGTLLGGRPLPLGYGGKAMIPRTHLGF